MMMMMMMIIGTWANLQLGWLKISSSWVDPCTQLYNEYMVQHQLHFFGSKHISFIHVLFDLLIFLDG